MILWINGAFGAGKTHAAREMHRRIKNSFIFDPENTGFYIRDNIPDYCQKSDFQYHALWRRFNNDMLKFIDRDDMIIIVPMTVTDTAYWHELTKNLNVRSVILCAQKVTIISRLQMRGEAVDCWAAMQADRCIEAFKNNFNTDNTIKIQTDNKSICEVCEEIAACMNITLN